MTCSFSVSLEDMFKVMDASKPEVKERDTLFYSSDKHNEKCAVFFVFHFALLFCVVFQHKTTVSMIRMHCMTQTDVQLEFLLSLMGMYHHA